MENNDWNNNPISPSEYDINDFQQNKVMAALAYILFFLPLIACPKSLYARYHANQGLILFICGVAVSIVTYFIGWVPIVGWIISLVLRLLIVCYVIIGISNALTGKKSPLPFIGNFQIIH
jgi:uncharacterized membrane protein